MSRANVWDIRLSSPSSKPVHPNPNPPRSTAVLIFTERGWPASVDGWPDLFRIARMSSGCSSPNSPSPQVDPVQGGD